MAKPRRQRGRIRPARDRAGNERRGAWEVSWEIGDGTSAGRRRRSKTVEGGKGDAQRYLRDRLKEVDQGRAVARSNESFGAYLDRWFAGLDTSKTAPRTRARYRKLIDQHIKPGIGTVRLQDLDADVLARFYASKRLGGRLDGQSGGLSDSTVLQMHAIIHKSLGAATRARRIPRNPCEDLDEKPVASVATQRRLTTEEVAAIVRAVTASSRAVNLHLPVTLAAYTGMRRGEVLGLRWVDVDLRHGSARVAQTMYKIGKTIAYKPPKGKQARTVHLPAPALGALRARWNERERLRREVPGFDDHGLVCTRPLRGQPADPCDPDIISKSFARFCGRHGFGDLHFHMLRHAAARTGLHAGVDLQTISRRLGHSTIGITAAFYLGDDADLDEQAARRLDGVYEAADRAASEQTGGTTGGTQAI